MSPDNEYQLDLDHSSMLIASVEETAWTSGRAGQPRAETAIGQKASLMGRGSAGKGGQIAAAAAIAAVTSEPKQRCARMDRSCILIRLT